jgi:UDP-N-acetylmuramate dehydrogenase|tara:strand:+ start:15620 stop:16639 length:1020 start_codon:yes stop_codon:yes gene_type:complete
MTVSISNNYPLEHLNTFRISATAKLFYEFKNEESLKDILSNDIVKKEKVLVLGGGSNILITKDFDGIVLKNSIQGITIISKNRDNLLVKVGSGVNWHDFVLWSVEKNLSGIENLALIPGLVGASPMQNIGAYGMEVKDTIYKVHYIDIKSRLEKTLTNQECNFSYRNSIFKAELKDKVIITKVIFKLSKHNLNNISYGAITSELKSLKKEASCKTICEAVINIRSRKLPDPKHIGNSGSFFKNPVITNNNFNELKTRFPDIIGYEYSNTHTKVAAGWLIEKAGWKGFKEDNVGVYEKQALVLVNYGGADGKKILKLAKKIQESIFSKFKIKILPEVNII